MEREIKNIKAIDRPKAIAFISELINQELEDKEISEAVLGWRMSKLSQATINKLRLGKFNNIPNFDTLEAIAVYYGRTLSEFIAILEQECPATPQPDFDNRLVVNLIYQVKDLKTLAEIADIATSMLKADLFRQQ